MTGITATYEHLSSPLQNVAFGKHIVSNHESQLSYNNYCTIVELQLTTNEIKKYFKRSSSLRLILILHNYLTVTLKCTNYFFVVFREIT